MTATDIDAGVLQWLDFEFAAPCDVRRCEHEAASTTKYVVHEECQAHTRWYALCQTHTDKSVEGKTACKGCGDTLAVMAVLYL